MSSFLLTRCFPIFFLVVLDYNHNRLLIQLPINLFYSFYKQPHWFSVNYFYFFRTTQTTTMSMFSFPLKIMSFAAILSLRSIQKFLTILTVPTNHLISPFAFNSFFVLLSNTLNLFYYCLSSSSCCFYKIIDKT